MKLEDLTNKELLDNTRCLVAEGKKLDIQILKHLAEIKNRRLETAIGFGGLGGFCEKFLGLSKDSAWKKSQAVNIIEAYPWLFQMLEAGKTHLSHIAMLAPRLTRANEELIFNFLPDKTKKELTYFLSRVGFDGSISDKEEEIELKIACPKRVMEKFERARALLTKDHKGVSAVELLEKALDALLDKKDPVRKAKRAEERRRVKLEDGRGHCAGAVASLKEDSGGVQRSRYIPAESRHEVYSRPLIQCEYVSPDGRQCTQVNHLQIDHKKMWSEGGGHEATNLRLLCAKHNRFVAGEILGHEYMESFLVQ